MGFTEVSPHLVVLADRITRSPLRGSLIPPSPEQALNERQRRVPTWCQSGYLSLNWVVSSSRTPNSALFISAPCRFRTAILVHRLSDLISDRVIRLYCRCNMNHWRGPPMEYSRRTPEARFCQSSSWRLQKRGQKAPFDVQGGGFNLSSEYVYV